jgi:hypothetical protein
MPGVGMIGIASRYTEEKSGSTAASVSAQVRTLNRMLALLPSSEEASCVMRDSLSALSASSSSSSLLATGENRLVRGIHKKLLDSIPGVATSAQQQSKAKSPAKKKAACRKGEEIMKMAQAVDRALETAFGEDEDGDETDSNTTTNNNVRKLGRRKSAYNVFALDYAQQKHATKNTRGGFVQLASEAWKELSSSEQQDYEGIAERMDRRLTAEHSDSVLMPPPAPRQTDSSSMTKEAKQSSRTALISDSEDGVMSATEEELEATETQLDQELVKMDLWANLLEAVHLEVSARTTRAWGKKKIYEVYQMAGPAMPVSNVEDIRQRIQKEFLAVYDGSIAQDNVRAIRYSECRVYATIRSDPLALWIQVNVGLSSDLSDEVNRSITGKKKQKAATEFLAVVTPESPLVILTASRAASRSPFTPYVLSALETCLTCSVVGGYASKRKHDSEICGRCSWLSLPCFQYSHPCPFVVFLPTEDASKRLGGMAGTEPYELLKEARVLESRNAAGRFLSYAAEGESQDPISELQTAATSSLLSRQNEQTRLQVGAKRGRHLANLSAQVAIESNGQSSLVAANQAGALVDHSARETQLRKRHRDDAFGRTEDCPIRQHVRWDWKGKTSAAAACLLEDIDAQDEANDLPQHTFKCRVVLQGSDVFQGMRSLVEAGLMEGPLPDYVKDAPRMRSTIIVDHGAIVAGKDDASNK